jgi:hypothetical protein
MSFNGVSKHVKILEKAGFIDREIQGTTHVCHLNAAELADRISFHCEHTDDFSARRVRQRLENLVESGFSSLNPRAQDNALANCRNHESR